VSDPPHWRRLMRVALREAEKGRGRTSPNPVVGAVVARGGRVIASGHHERAGLPHAEINALDAAGARARGADLFVTLEPCDHFGRTPPCTRRIIASGVKRVLVGTIDPNHRVCGRGIRRLRGAGLEVHVGVEQAACAAANEGWAKFITTGIPWVVLKVAATLDGRLATRSGDSRWVTGVQARALVHRWRNELDAVLVGIGTVLADDPRLTARGRGHRDPIRVVVGSRRRVPPRARVLPALIASTAAGSDLRCRSRGGDVDLRDLLKRLGARGIASVLVEGGSRIHGSFLKTGLWDELRLFVAPKVLGEPGLTWASFAAPAKMAGALAVGRLRVEMVGKDLLVRARRV